MDVITQKNNIVGKDQVAGDKYETNFNLINATSIDELTVLYSKLKENGSGDASNGNFCEQLEHYLNAKTDGDVRGLEEKLTQSGRADQLDLAKELKERAAKSVMRHQSSRTAQRIYTILLDELHTSFTLTVSPVIQADGERREIDLCIQHVLQNTKSMLGENLLELTVKDLLALLYFLGGNCHIRWDKMLIYHPAFDAYHCVFRLLGLTEMVSHLEIEKIRLLDFYILFPAAIASIRLPAHLRDARKLAKNYANVYHDPINPATTFRDMRHIQEAALKCIAAAGLIDIQQFETGFVVRTGVKLADGLATKVHDFLINHQPITNIVVNDIASIPLRGIDGLKHRTELMEYKYDAA